MTRGPFRTEAHHDAAAIIVATATAARAGHGHEDTLLSYVDDTGRLRLHDGDPVGAVEMAVGATVLLEQIVRGVGMVLGIDPDETLARTGQWVAEQRQGA